MNAQAPNELENWSDARVARHWTAASMFVDLRARRILRIDEAKLRRFL